MKARMKAREEDESTTQDSGSSTLISAPGGEMHSTYKKKIRDVGRLSCSSPRDTQASSSAAGSSERSRNSKDFLDTFGETLFRTFSPGKEEASQAGAPAMEHGVEVKI